MRRSSSKTPRIRSSRTSTPIARARRFRRSSSTCSPGIVSRARCGSRDLFSQATICDYLFDRDKIYAYLNLDDNELFIYQRLFDLLARDIPPPDLVDLPAGADRRAASAGCSDRAATPKPDVAVPDDDVPQELNEAYQHFFFHYTATPLLVVETSQLRPAAATDEIARRSDPAGRRRMAGGTRYYVPRA